MEERTKRRVELDIAGIAMTIVTDEPEQFVESVAEKLDGAMTELLSHTMKRSQLEAAMLCAIDFCADKLTAEKRVRNLEAQISLYDVNLKRLRDEISELKARLAQSGDADVVADNASDNGADSAQFKIDDEVDEAESARSEKLRLIEALLKKEK